LLRNLETKAEGISTPQSFDMIEHQVLKTAVTEFKKQGGTIDENKIFNRIVLKA
jgi:hypothetical protein